MDSSRLDLDDKTGVLGFLLERREYRKFLSFLHQVEGFWFRPQLDGCNLHNCSSESALAWEELA